MTVLILDIIKAWYSLDLWKIGLMILSSLMKTDAAANILFSLEPIAWHHFHLRFEIKVEWSRINFNLVKFYTWMSQLRKSLTCNMSKMHAIVASFTFVFSMLLKESSLMSWPKLFKKVFPSYVEFLMSKDVHTFPSKIFILANGFVL